MFARSLFVIVATLVAMPVSAQSLGTFSWQLQPFCNVITVNVTAVAGVYTLEGADDQCGGGTRAPLTGIATPNPDGSLTARRAWPLASNRRREATRALRWAFVRLR